MTHNKKGEKSPGMFFLMLGILALLSIFGWAAYQGGLFSSGGVNGDKESPSGFCPTDGDTSFTLDVYNGRNTTGAEGFDVGAYIYAEEGTSWVRKAAITDTTSPSATLIDCGFNYRVCAVASNSDGGDNSVFTGVRSGDAEIDENGCVEFEADRSNEAIIVDAEQHDVLTFKLYDKVDARYAFDTGDAEAVTFEADGVTFTDGDNATAFALASGGYLDFSLEVKGADEDEDFVDAYVLILIEAPVAEYKEPVLKYEGQTLTDISDDGLTDYEDKQFSSYEYIYKVSKKDIGSQPKTVSFYMEAVSGANPSTDVQIDFASAGNYLSTDGVSIKQGAAADDASNTVVFAVQDVTVDVS